MKEVPIEAIEAETLAQDLFRLAKRLRQHEPESAPTAHDPPSLKGVRSVANAHLALARSLYRERRLRDRYLTGDLFGEPIWDMLLDLYVARFEMKDVHVTSLCAASCRPLTTALRWIAVLEERNMVRRINSPHDKRVQYLELTDDAFHRMRWYLSRIAAERGENSEAFMLGSAVRLAASD